MLLQLGRDLITTVDKAEGYNWHKNLLLVHYFCYAIIKTRKKLPGCSSLKGYISTLISTLSFLCDIHGSCALWHGIEIFSTYPFIIQMTSIIFFINIFESQDMLYHLLGWRL